MSDQAELAQDVACSGLPLTICSKCQQAFATPSLWFAHAQHCNPLRYAQVARQLQQLPTYYLAPAPTLEEPHADYPG